MHCCQALNVQNHKTSLNIVFIKDISITINNLINLFKSYIQYVTLTVMSRLKFFNILSIEFYYDFYDLT